MKDFDTFIVVVGPSGSGKSTYVERFLAENSGFICVSPDNLRLELTGDTSDQSKNGFIFNTLLPIRINGARAKGKGCVINATSTTRKARKLLLEYAKMAGYQRFECHVLEVPIEVCKIRNASRDRVVPVEVIDRQFAQFQKPEMEEGFDEIKTIDLTLAHK